MKKIFLVLTFLLIVPQLGSHEQDKDFFSSFVAPYVLLILDTSASMLYNMANEMTYGDGTVGGNTTIRVSGTNYDVVNPFYGLRHDTTGAYDSDRYGDKSRSHIVKEAVCDALDEFGGKIRWGLATFFQEKNPSNPSFYADGWYNAYYYRFGWRNFTPELQWYGDATSTANEQFDLRVTISEAKGDNESHINLIRSWLDSEVNGYTDQNELRSTCCTPIAPALRGARYWYSDEIQSLHSQEKWCRKYFVILLTDGEPTVGIDQSDYGTQGVNADHSAFDYGSPQWMKNQCYWEAESLLHTYVPGLGGDPDTTFEIQTYVVGIGQQIHTLDTIAMSGGTEHYYYAGSSEEVLQALRDIFAAIIRQASSFAAGEVTSIEEEFLASEYEARMYLASFYPSGSPFWEGHLKAIKLPTGGNIAVSLDSIPDSLIIWDAGDLLRARDPATRNIYGVKGGSLLEFDTINFNSGDLDVSSSADADTVVSLLRSGVRVLDTTRSYLGDIFHSAPLRAGSPNYFYHDDDFYKYRDSMNNIRQRPTVIYAGSNTGMIQGFLDTNGAELFSVIPENFISQVKTLRDSHRFYVDADPVAADIWFPSEDADSFKNMDEWKTILLAAQGEGGRGITALDISDPDYPLHAFSFYEDTMALTTSIAIIPKVERIVGSDTVERFFALFGGGEWPDSLYDIYDPTSTGTLKGNVIVAIDICDAVTNGLSYGSNFWYIPAASGDEDKMVYPFAAAGNILNVNPQEGNVYDFFYIADIAGQLWKVNLRDPDVSSWSARCIFQPIIPANSGQAQFWQPVFYRPHIERDPGLGCYWLFYGTGDRSRVFNSPTENRFYAVMDTLVDAETYPIREEDGDLLKISPSGSFDPASDFPTYKGWYAVYSDYGHDDEKTVGYAGMYMDTVKVVTFSPEETGNPCAPSGGVARAYYFQFRTGELGRMRSLGTGIPQAPRYSFDLEGGGVEIIQTSDSLWIEQKAGSGAIKRIMKWKER